MLKICGHMCCYKSFIYLFIYFLNRLHNHFKGVVPRCFRQGHEIAAAHCAVCTHPSHTFLAVAKQPKNHTEIPYLQMTPIKLPEKAAYDCSLLLCNSTQLVFLKREGILLFYVTFLRGG